MSDNISMEFEASYNSKDLILYALSIGVGSSRVDVNDDELKFLYERHENFAAIPTFCLALTFWAEPPAHRRNKQIANTTGSSTCGIPSFPPPLMVQSELIPRPYLKQSVSLSAYPILHTWQSVVWHQPMPVPKVRPLNDMRYDQGISTTLKTQTISIVPKSIGTFVTSETKVQFNNDETETKRSLVCTMQSTALILGLPEDTVIAYDSGTPQMTCHPQIPIHRRPLVEWTYRTVPNQALLYRIASGDSNRIHVDDSASQRLGRDVPLLHGLCTLAIAFRGLQLVVEDAHTRISKLEAKFARPVFVGDEVCIRIWHDDPADGNKDGNVSQQQSIVTRTRYLFVVLNSKTEETLVDNGFAEFHPRTVSHRSSKL